MVYLDDGLIHSARSLITGANVHHAKGLIFVYEQAVLLHNKGSRAHVIYQERHEKSLRRFVERENGRASALNTAQDRNHAVMQCALEALERAQSARRSSRNLDERVTEALLLGDEAYILRREKKRERRQPKRI